MVGSLLAMYGPLACVAIYESSSGEEVNSTLFSACLVALMCSPAINGFVFGLKNRVYNINYNIFIDAVVKAFSFFPQLIHVALLNFARKEMYKSEVQQEIRLRSPGGGGGGDGATGPVGGGFGSNRPSMGNIVGHITLNMPTYLTRQLSYTSLAPVRLKIFFYIFSWKTFGLLNRTPFSPAPLTVASPPAPSVAPVAAAGAERTARARGEEGPPAQGEAYRD